MDRSPGFGSSPSDSIALFRLAFATLPLAVKLATETNSLTHYTKGTQSQTEVCSHGLYAHGFRVCFTPLPGFFSPFPHGTGSLSVNNEYLALEDGPPVFGQGCSCPGLLDVIHPTALSSTGLSPAAAAHSRAFD